jgi:hypothetical protein
MAVDTTWLGKMLFGKSLPKLLAFITFYLWRLKWPYSRGLWLWLCRGWRRMVIWMQRGSGKM